MVERERGRSANKQGLRVKKFARYIFRRGWWRATNAKCAGMIFSILPVIFCTVFLDFLVYP